MSQMNYPRGKRRGISRYRQTSRGKPRGMYPTRFNKFDEYKFFVEDTARLSERRQTVTNIYVAVNTILLSAVALLVKDAGLQRWAIAAATLLILVAGIAICLFWRQLIIRYKELVGLRLGVLRKMEELPEMAGCLGMYHIEDSMYPRDAQGNKLKTKGRMDFSDLERQLPNVFIVLYVLFLAGIVIAAVTGAI